MIGEKPRWAVKVMSTHNTLSGAQKSQRALMHQHGLNQKFQICEVRNNDWIRTTDPWAVVRVR
jgi:hypothetical protein